MAVAARAANIVEGNADRRVGIARLHCQIEINDRAASVTREVEPVMLRGERGDFPAWRGRNGRAVRDRVRSSHY